VVTIASLTAALYLAFKRDAAIAQRGSAGCSSRPAATRSAHVFVCLAVASVPALASDGLGLVGNTLVQAGRVRLPWTMVRHRVLFRCPTHDERGPGRDVCGLRRRSTTAPERRSIGRSQQHLRFDRARLQRRAAPRIARPSNQPVQRCPAAPRIAPR
jgi:hypothetical protein